MSDPDEPPPPQVSADPQEGHAVAPETVAILEGLVDDAVRAPSPALLERLEMLIDGLILRGHLNRGHARLLQRLKGAQGSTRIYLSQVTDKRSVPSPDIDCASLLHLCKGRCCAMRVSLSEEDLNEHKLAWDLQQPYSLRRDPDHGYCSYLGEGGACGVYHDRPATCRAYDCRKDRRVWVDWEQKIPAEVPWHLVPEAWMRDDQRDAESGDAGPTTSAG